MAALKERLQRLPANRLRAVAAAWEVEPDGALDAAGLLAALEDPIVVKRRLARLPDAQLAILATLDEADGPLSARLLAARLDVPPDHITPDLRRLSDLLLIGRSRLFEGSLPAGEPPEPVDVPLEIRAELRPFVHQVVSRRTLPPQSDRLPAATAAQPARLWSELLRRGGRAPYDDLARRLGEDILRAEYLAGRADGWLDEAFTHSLWWLMLAQPPDEPRRAADRDEGTALLGDLLVLAEAVERTGLALGNAEWSLRPERHGRLRAALRGSPVAADARLAWLIRLIVGLGLGEPAGRTLEPSGALSTWAGLSFTAQAAKILEFWRDDLAWSEPASAGRWAAALDRPRLRSMLMQQLRALDPAREAPLAEIARAAAAESGAARPGRWSEVSQAQAQALVGSMLDHTLAWLGIVAIEQNGRTALVRLTEFGGRVLAGDDPPPPDDPSLVVQGDLEILCIASPPAVLARVLRATEIVDPGAVSLHRLTRDCFLGALDRGETAAGLLDFLSRHSRSPVPDSVGQSLHDWAGAYRAVTVRPAVLVEFDPPLGPDDFDPDSALAALIARHLGPGVAELYPGVDFSAFREAAEAAGFRLRRGPRHDR